MSEKNLIGKKVLIVEDDYSSRLYLNKLIEKSGIEVLNATNGSEAFQIASKDNSIDLILMDIQMPLVDGYTCTMMLRDSGCRSVIIAQTAFGLTGDKEKFLSSGFNDYLIKPVSKGQLFEKLTLYLH